MPLPFSTHTIVTREPSAGAKILPTKQDAADPIILKGNDVWLAANHVYKNCCYDVSGYSGLNAYQGLSGQKFVKSGSTNYNAIISYANCKQPVDIRPGGAGGQGINQACSGGVTPGGS